MNKQIALKSDYPFCGGRIILHRDGTATLRVRINGVLVHNKVHKNEKSARAAWYRWVN